MGLSEKARKIEIRILLGSMAVLWLIATTLVVMLEGRFPGTDVFLFKEAGVNLATKGQFVAANIIHMPPDQDLPYAMYPPLYAFSFGLWSSVLGVGIKQSLLFESLLRGGRMILLILMVWPFLGRALSKGGSWKKGAIALFLMVVLSLLSSDSDRPDELGLVLGLSSWLLFSGASVARMFGAAILLGLTGATSPAAGLFFALGIGGMCWPMVRHWKRLVFCGGVSLASFLGVTLPIVLKDPSAYARFSKQAYQSTLPYPIPFVETGGRESILAFLSEFHHYIKLGWPYVFCVVALCLVLFVFGSQKKRILGGGCKYPLGLAGVLFVPVAILIWTLQPYYLWFSCVCLFGAAILVFLYTEKRSSVVAIGILMVVSVGPLIAHEGKGFLNSLQVPSTQRASVIRDRVFSHVAKGKRIAISHDQYFTFRGYRQIANIAYVCPWLDRYDFVYVTGHSNTHVSRRHPTPVPCQKMRHCFVPIADFSSKKRIHIFGMKTAYYVRSNGGVLYRNDACKGENNRRGRL